MNYFIFKKRIIDIPDEATNICQRSHPLKGIPTTYQKIIFLDMV